MMRRPALKTYEHAALFRKAQIVKARCIIIQVPPHLSRSLPTDAGP